MRIEELDYNLPDRLIAQKPVEPRDHSRLLVVDRKRKTFYDKHFYDLPDFLRPKDVLVLNDTKVIPARLFFHKITGGKIEGLFLQEVQLGLWRVMLKGASKLSEGSELFCEETQKTNFRFFLHRKISAKTFELRVQPEAPALEVLASIGHVPLPPYIHHDSVEEQNDKNRYQTIFSKHPGAVAAPTAGLHFTQELLEKIDQIGVQSVRVTLHVGLGTFEPISVTELRDHPMHAEWFSLSPESAETINRAKETSSRIVAVGTTSVRVLESSFRDGKVMPGDGWTNLFLYPPCTFNIIDSMITNFHLPRTTLLAMIYAFAGIDLARIAYDHAIDQSYRFYSYGDSMLIL
jgi:S-adenosylmethionine:tRNA ribosyltransferase-isomerase